jgi:ABC-type multidrug transport system permease subunit
MRFVIALFNACMLGAAFYHLGLAQTVTKFGLMQLGLLQIAFNNMSEMMTIFADRGVFWRHRSSALYPASAWVGGMVLVHFPIAVVESLAYSAILYTMTGLYLSAANFFFFWFMMFLSDMTLAQIFRAVGFATGSLERAMSIMFPINMIMMTFAGFFLPTNRMGWMTFLSYISPFAYALKALAINELEDPAYAAPMPGPPGHTQPTLGQYYLSLFDFPSSLAWKYGALAYFVGFWLVVGIVAIIIAELWRDEPAYGASRAALSSSIDAVPKPLRHWHWRHSQHASSIRTFADAIAPHLTAAPSGSTKDALSVGIGSSSTSPANGVVSTTSAASASVDSVSSTMVPRLYALVFKDIKYTVQVISHCTSVRYQCSF